MKEKFPKSEWGLLSTSYVLNARWMKIKKDVVSTHNKKNLTYFYQDHPGSVLVVAITDDRKIVLLRHYRHPVRDWCLEIPSGRIEENKSEIETAKKELYEEAGGISSNWQDIGAFYNSTGSSNECSKVFLARDVTLGASNPNHTELLEVKLFSFNKAVEMAKGGEIKDGAAALAILMASLEIKTN